MKPMIPSQSGSVIVEFLLVFPAFLVLSLFTLEIGFMWSDKHITRLAAFEAARSLASAPLPEPMPDGSFESDPCIAPQAMAAARQAALRKMAIITPSVFYMNAQLGSFRIPGLDTLDSTLSALPSAARRMLSRWPTAAAFTRLNCHYDPGTQTVATAITYYRAPQTPVAGRVMWVAHMISKAAASGNVLDIRFKHDFFGLEGHINLLQQDELRVAIADSLNVIRDTAMEAEQAAAFLSTIPGADLIFGSLSTPDAIGNVIDQTITDVSAEASQIIAAATQVQIGSQLLTAAVYATPKSLRFIPLHVKSFATRGIYGPNARQVAGQIRDAKWHGVVRGVARMNNGVFHDWSRAMSVNPTHISNGVPLYD